MELFRRSHRSHHRVPIRLFVDQYMGREHWIGLTFDLSEGGVYLCQRPQPAPGEMGVELNLPGLRESIWTRAKVHSVRKRGGFMGMGLAFTAMAKRHRGLLHDWLAMARTQIHTIRTERRSTVRQVPLAG